MTRLGARDRATLPAFTLLALMSLGGLAAGCGTSAPKPRELDAYETLRKSTNLPEVSKRSPDLVAGAEKLSDHSREEWQSDNLEESRRDALMAQIKLKTAIALTETDQLKARIQTLSSEQAQAEEEYATVAKDLASEKEKLALLEKYLAVRKSADAEQQRLSQQMNSEQQKAAAEQQRLSQQLASEQKISAAQLSLRTADTVEAQKYAKAEYTAAGDMLAKAEAELKQSDFAAAQASAEVAKKNADRAAEISKPLYEQAEQASQNKARDEALSRDASGIPGVTVHLERRGDLQRLVLIIPELFLKRQPSIAPGHDGVLDALASLINKYPSYPVQVVGFTDNRGKSAELVAVSAARAQAVYSALASRGVETKRLMTSGLGGDEPYYDNKTASGRAKNNRVEIVFLYH
jgi:outer membrane protein OmpA-like peptidoglycan-associated protein